MLSRRARLALALTLTLGGLLWWCWPRLPVPRPGSTLVLTLSGGIPERLAPTPLPAGLTHLSRWLRLADGQASTPLTMLEIAQLLQAAARDPRIVRLRIEPAGLRTGWAKLEELRAWIAAFARSGKPVDCYLRAPGMKEYFVAAAAQRIAIAPSGWLNLRGLRAEVTSWKGTLDKLGVVAEIEAIGRYKDAGDAVTSEAMSPETRQVLDSFLDARLTAWSTAVASGRGRPVAEVARWLDDGPYLAARAKELGLVDSLEFAPPDPEEGTRAESYRWIRPAVSGARVAVLVLDSAIDEAAARQFHAAVKAVASSQPRGVMVRINSPGGEIAASDQMLHELNGLRQKVPVIFSFSDVAASGGYALAMTGDPIHASPGTVTGSIGVLFGKVDLRGLYAKLGIRKELLLRGKQAAIDSEVHPLGTDGRRRLRAALQTMYDGFVQQVAAARRLAPAPVAALAEGRAWLGSQAQENALIDAVDGWDGAVADMKRKLGLNAQDQLDLVIYPERDSWLDRVQTGQGLTEALTEALGEWAVLGQSLHRGAMLRHMYYSVDIE